MCIWHLYCTKISSHTRTSEHNSISSEPFTNSTATQLHPQIQPIMAPNHSGEERRGCSICIEDGRTSLLCHKSMTTVYIELDKVCRGMCKDFLEILFIHRAYPSSDFAWGRGYPHSNNLWPARDNNVQTFIVVTSHSSRWQSCMPTLIFYHI